MKFDVCICSDDEIFAHMLVCELQFAGYRAMAASQNQHCSGPFRLYLIDADNKNPTAIPKGIPVIRFSSSKDENKEDIQLVRPFKINDLIALAGDLISPAQPTEKAAGKTKPTVSAHKYIILSDSGRSVTVGSRTASLSPREYLLFKLLYERMDQPVSRKEAAITVWGKEAGDTNVVDVYIYYLREKLKESFGDKMIHTVRNKGYILMPNTISRP